jgi:hypothetical protein
MMIMLLLMMMLLENRGSARVVCCGHCCFRVYCCCCCFFLVEFVTRVWFFLLWKSCKTVFVVIRVLFWNARNITTNGCFESVGIV